MKTPGLILFFALLYLGGCISNQNLECCRATYGLPYPKDEVPPGPSYLSNLEPLPNCSALTIEYRRPDDETLPYYFFRRQNRPMSKLTTPALVSVELEHKDTKERYEVFVQAPAGFVMDFTSRPPGTGMLVSNFGRHVNGSIIHDWLYAVGFPKEQGGEVFADQVFFQAVRDAGEHAFGRFMIITPLRIWPSGNYRGKNERIFWVDGPSPEWQSETKPSPEDRIYPYGYTYSVSSETADELRSKTVRICLKEGAARSDVDVESLSSAELSDLLRNLRGIGINSERYYKAVVSGRVWRHDLSSKNAD